MSNEMNNLEITFCSMGSVDAGKSSLLSCLINNKLDDGNGYARNLITKYKHEITTGKTSAISTHSIKNFNNSNKSLIFVDLCGHRKYLKTSLFGVTAYHPDYALLIVGGNRGVLEMTREHIKILYLLKIPMIIVITKTDLIDKLYEDEETKNSDKKNELTKITNDIKKVFSKGKFNVIDMNDIFENDKSTTDIIPNVKTIPLFKLSCKTGYGLEYLKQYIVSLPRRIDMKINKISTTNDFIFQIDTIYCPVGIGWVVSGILKSTNNDEYITPNTNVFLGPSKLNNEFIQAKIWSIHNYYNEKVDKLYCGQRGCLAIRLDKKITRNMFRKGSILTNNLDIIKSASYVYKARIKLLNHPTNVRDNFSPVIHCGTVRQTAKLKILDLELSKKNEKSNDITEKTNDTTEKSISSGETAIIEIKFMYRPEIIEPNQTFFLREGLTLGIGNFI
jgi:elongation factor 1-alpha